MTQPDSTLLNRANHKCEMCEGEQDLSVFNVEPAHETHPSQTLVCSLCKPELSSPEEGAAKDQHWFCLQSAMWSEVSAIKVLSLRLLTRFKSQRWAQDLLDQAYFEEDIVEWANAGESDEDEADDRPPTFDSNGTKLVDADSVTLIRDLDVKGTCFVAKRGTLVRGIRCTDDPAYVEGRVNKIAIMLKTCFLKKA